MEVLKLKLDRMAGTTGLEPATSDVTGRRSNQLNYVPALCRNCFMLTRVFRRTNGRPESCAERIKGNHAKKS